MPLKPDSGAAYVPAISTDIAATWRRFDFIAWANQRRRARLRAPLVETDGSPAEIAALRDLQLRVIAARMTL